MSTEPWRIGVINLVLQKTKRDEQLQQDLDQVENRRSTTLGLSSEKSNWGQDARKSPELRRIDQ